MMHPDDQQSLTTMLKLDPALAENMLQHGLVTKLVNGDYILTLKGEAEFKARDRDCAAFELQQQEERKRNG